jgi:hypothetical protein
MFLRNVVLSPHCAVLQRSGFVWYEQHSSDLSAISARSCLFPLPIFVSCNPLYPAVAGVCVGNATRAPVAGTAALKVVKEVKGGKETQHVMVSNGRLWNC